MEVDSKRSGTVVKRETKRLSVHARDGTRRSREGCPRRSPRPWDCAPSRPRRRDAFLPRHERRNRDPDRLQRCSPDRGSRWKHRSRSTPTHCLKDPRRRASFCRRCRVAAARHERSRVSRRFARRRQASAGRGRRPTARLRPRLGHRGARRTVGHIYEKHGLFTRFNDFNAQNS